ncbi:hypothetical protein NKH55_28575 [Mesorhizobium opportunistum]|uniref:hypothetical protein n=1 Tax=Mesorhizobium opportunistum TaxID=593909 RepID=UPI00333D4AB5
MHLADALRSQLHEIMDRDIGTTRPHPDIDTQDQAPLAREGRDRQQPIVRRKAQVLGSSDC